MVQSTMLKIYLDKKKTPDNEKKLEDEINSMVRELWILIDMLDHNVYSNRYQWSFHYQEYKEMVEQQIVNLWINLSELEELHEDKSLRRLKQ